MTLQELLAKRASNVKAMRELNDKVLSENRAYTAEETQAQERMDAEYADLDTKIATATKLAEREADLAKNLREPLADKREEDVSKANEKIEANYREVFPKLLSRGIHNLSSGEIGVVNAYRAYLNVTTPAEGGYLVPVSYQTTVLEKMRDVNIMRQLGNVIRTQSTEKIPLEGSDASFTWLDEGGAYGDSIPNFGQMQIDAHKAGGIIKLSEEILADDFINIEEYITKKIVTGMTELQETAFMTGDGTKKPTGIVTGSAFGKTTAVAGAVTVDEILDLIYAVKEGYAVRGALLMNRSTELVIRKLKDSNGQYLWQPAITQGTPNTFDGKAVRTSAYMPTLASGNKFMLFGDFSYYTIADRGTMALQRLNELYAGNGQIGWRVNARVDGKLTMSEAVKHLISKV